MAVAPSVTVSADPTAPPVAIAGTGKPAAPAKPKVPPAPKTEAKADAPEADPAAAAEKPGRKWEPYEWEDEGDKDAAGKPRKYRFETEHDFQQYVRKNNGADRRLREAAEDRKRVSAREKELLEFEAAFQKNPRLAARQYAKALGMTPEQLLSAFKEDQDAEQGMAELEKADPEKAQLLRIAQQQAAELEEHRTKLKADKDAAEKADFESKVQQNEKQMATERDVAMKELAEYGPEAQERLGPIVMDTLRIARAGNYRLSPKAVAAETRKVVDGFVTGHMKTMPAEQFGKIATERIAAMTPEEISTLIGVEKLREIGRYNVDQARKRQGLDPAPRASGQRPAMSSADEEVRRRVLDTVSGMG